MHRLSLEYKIAAYQPCADELFEGLFHSVVFKKQYGAETLTHSLTSTTRYT